MALNPVVMAVSGSGAEIARRVADALDVPMYGRAGRVVGADEDFANALEFAREMFAAGRPVIGVCASGILIRAVAPLLADKRAEPPVVSVSDDGETWHSWPCDPLDADGGEQEPDALVSKQTIHSGTPNQARPKQTAVRPA